MPDPASPVAAPEFVERARQLGELSRAINALWMPQAIHAACVLGVPDALAKGASRSEEVAKAVNAHPQALRRLLRALVALGICTETADGAFELSAAGDWLRSGTRDSFRASVLLRGSQTTLRSWARLADCVRTGESATKLEAGLENPFEWFAAHPEEQAVFDEAMVEFTRQAAGAVALAYDFTGVRTLTDVGGGYGALLPAILGVHPEMRGVVFDLPHCRDGALRLLEKTRLSGRCEFVGGSFFDFVPPGADAYVLKHVLHGWSDERCAVILRNCRAPMRADSRLLVLESLVPERAGASLLDQMVAGTDLNMLVAAGGRERSDAEYRALLAAAGLRVTSIAPTLASLHVLDARV